MAANFDRNLNGAARAATDSTNSTLSRRHSFSSVSQVQNVLSQPTQATLRQRSASLSDISLNTYLSLLPSRPRLAAFVEKTTILARDRQALTTAISNLNIASSTTDPRAEQSRMRLAREVAALRRQLTDEQTAIRSQQAITAHDRFVRILQRQPPLNYEDRRLYWRNLSTLLEQSLDASLQDSSTRTVIRLFIETHRDHNLPPMLFTQTMQAFANERQNGTLEARAMLFDSLEQLVNSAKDETQAEIMEQNINRILQDSDCMHNIEANESLLGMLTSAITYSIRHILLQQRLLSGRPASWQLVRDLYIKIKRALFSLRQSRASLAGLTFRDCCNHVRRSGIE